MMRNWEAASQQPAAADVANAVDAVRANYAEAQQPQQAQTEQQQPQPQQADVHPDVLAALQYEHVRDALAKEVAAAEEARQSYANGLRAKCPNCGCGFVRDVPRISERPD